MPDRSLLAEHPSRVAPLLLGGLLTSEVGGVPVRLRLTEVEAYGGVGEDPGSHAHRRRTDRNATMFGPVGHLYVYFTYGMHHCLNVVAHDHDGAGAVLLRAGEILDGVAAARARRPAARADRDLARGPARLAAALGVDRSCDGLDLLDPTSPVRLVLVEPATPRDRAAVAPTTGTAQPSVRSGPRTGVRNGAGTPWRFWLDPEPTVSPYRPAAPRPRRPTSA